MARPLCHLIPLNIHEEAYLPLKDAAVDDSDGNVSEYIRKLIYRDLIAREKIKEVDVIEWTL